MDPVDAGPGGDTVTAAQEGDRTTMTRRIEDERYRRLIGQRIKAKRVWLALSQDEVAAKAEVTRNFVSAIERGAQGLDVIRLRRLSGALGVDFAVLVSTDHDGWTL